MRLATKMTLVLVMAMTLVVGVFSVVSINEQRAQLLQDARTDNTIMARTLADGVATAHRYGGETAARELVDAVDRNHPEISFAWFTPAGPKAGGVIPGPEWESRAPTVRSEAPVISAHGETLGTVSVVDSLQDDEAILWSRVERVILTAIVMAIVGASVAIGLGRRYVSRPVAVLSQKAARIGRGDFRERLVLRGSDELARLAMSMNSMADELAASHARVREETAAKIRALEQLRHAERLATVGQLAAGIAHELGTPLNVVDARAAMIEAGDTTEEETQRFATMIREQAMRMTRVIRQLLGFARPHPPTRARVDLGALATQVCELVQPLAGRHHVSVSLSSLPTAMSDLDGRQIEQAITNIVVNAIQACSEGGSVRVSISDDDMPPPADVAPHPAGFFRICVADDGQGMPPEDLPRVFEPFFTTKDVGQGTGLGLSVTYGIIREHGGWIDAHSPEERGSVFCVHLPKAEVA